ncbi:MAG: FtsX-like permease family protein [Desulfurococcaceae archaeon]
MKSIFSKHILLVIIPTALIISLLYSIVPHSIVYQKTAHMFQYSSSTAYSINITDFYWDSILNDLYNLSNLTDKTTGSSGFNYFTWYIYNKLRGLPGVKVILQNYTIPIPVDNGSFIEYSGGSIKAYPMYPSGGVPVNTFIEGKAIVLKSLDDMNHKILENSIVFIDMGVNWDWINLLDPSIGVKAVIFYCSESIVRSRVYDKYFDAPVNLPLGYVSMSYDELLNTVNGSDIKVRLSSKWDVREAYNIVVYVKGVSNDYTILLVTHYDSWSPVVGLAPGASDTIAPLYLTHLVEYMVNNTPPYDTIIVFFSGFYQGLVGHRLFVEEYIHQRKPIVEELAIDPQRTLIIGLDITYGSKYVTPVSIGYFYSAQDIGITAGPLNYYSGFINTVFSEQEYRIIGDPIFRRIVEYSTSSATWWQLVPGPYWLDTEPFWSSGLPAFTLKTAFSENRFRSTPVDFIERLLGDIDNVRIQLKLIDRVLSAIFSKDQKSLSSAISTGLSPRAPTRTPRTARNEMFTKLTGRVYIWDPFRDTKEEISKYGFRNALVIVRAGSRTRSSNTWNVRLAVFTDSDGFFELTGLHHYVATSLEITALLLDSEGKVFALSIGGRISTGSNIGIGEAEIGSREAPWEVYVYPYNGSITINMLVNPSDLQTPFEGAGIGVGIIESETQAPPQFYRIYVDETGYTVIYVDKYMDYDIIIGPNPVMYVYTNVKPGSKLSTLKGLEDTIRICEERYLLLKNYGIANPVVESYLNISKSLYSNALSNLENRRYTDYLTNLYAGLSTANQLYASVKSTYLDITNTGILYSVLLVLSGFIFGLLFRKHGQKPVSVFIKTLLVLIALGSIFGLLHPAFKLTTNAIMAVIGFVAFILTIPILLVLISDFNEALAVIRRAVKGIHKVEVSKFATSYVALSYGVEHMRRRKLRTALTLTTLIVIVIGLVLFTSLTSYVEPKPIAVKSTPTRPEGYLIQLEGIDRNFPLGSLFLELTRSVVSRDSYGRFWYTGTVYVMLDKDPSKRMDFEGIIAIDPSEFTKLNLTGIIIAGTFFTECSCREVLIPKTSVDDLRIKYNVTISVNDTVLVMGVPFRIIGIYDDEVFMNIRELERDTPLTPVKGFPRSRAYRVIIIPTCIIYENPWLSKGVSLFLAQIAIYMEGSIAEAKASELIKVFPTVDFYLYSINKGVYKYSKLIAIRGSGFYYIVPPLIIASISVSSVLLGSLYERRREIYIYASIGLSPLQIGLMFLAETIAYGLISVVVGYATSLAATNILANMYPEAFKPNYSSGYVVLSLGFTMVAVVLATLYPIYKAGRMALPSLKRKWEYPTKPVGDEWIIPLPFKFTSFRDLSGAFTYIFERLSSFTSIDVGNFVIEKIDIDKRVESNGVNYVLRGEVRLKPWQAGIKQLFEIKAIMIKPEEWDLSIYIKRISGNPTIWFKSNKYFIDDLRKQLLLWRTLSQEDKDIYIQKSILA